MKTLVIWAIAGLVAVLGSAGGLLDGQDDHHAEHAQAKSLEDAQRAARREHAREIAAVRFCRATVGESSVIWRHDGEPVCVPRLGSRFVSQVTP